MHLFISLISKGHVNFWVMRWHSHVLFSPNLSAPLWHLIVPVPSVLIPLWKQCHWFMLHLWNSVCLPYIEFLYFWLFSIIQSITSLNNNGYNTYPHHIPVLTIKGLVLSLCTSALNCVLKCSKGSGGFAAYADHQNSFLLKIPVETLKGSLKIYIYIL